MKNRISRRQFLSVLGAAAAAAALTACGGASSAASSAASTASGSASASGIDLSGVTLRIAAASASNGHGLVQAAGLDDTPYKVDFTVLQGGNLVMEALAAGQIALGTGSQIPPLAASQAANGGNFKIIGVRRMHTLDQELIIPAGSTLTEVSQLKGKTVGYVKNTTAHYFLEKMLEEAGLEWTDIDAVALTTSDGLSAVLTGEVDALASYGNAIRTAKAKGCTTLRSAADILSGDYYWYATPDSIADAAAHAALVDWLSRYNEAAEWARQNPEAYAKFYADLTGEDKDDVLERFTEEEAQTHLSVRPVSDETIASEQDIADTFYKLGVFASPIEAAPLFDHSFDAELAALPQY